METAPFLREHKNIEHDSGGFVLAGNHSRKVRQYKKPVTIDLGMIFFGVIFIYIIVCVFMYFTTKHVAGYQVKIGSLYVNNVYTGFAVREETIINSEYSGYLNYYTREGTRIGANKMICTVDEGGRLQNIIEEQSRGENSLSESDLNEIRDDIMEFAVNFETNNFSSIYDFKYSIEGAVLKRANANILENLEQLNLSGDSGLINICKAPTSGIVVYSYDGYEQFNPTDITKEILNKTEYKKNQLLGNELISMGDPIYKLVTSEDWYLIIETDADRAELLQEEGYILVKFLKNQTTSWAQASVVHSNDKGSFVKLAFNNSMITFCTDRYVDIELVLEEEEGLKVPNSAIAEKSFYMVPDEFVSQEGENGEMGVTKELYDEDGNKVRQFIPVTIYSKEESKYYIDSPQLKLGDNLYKLDSDSTHTISESGTLVGVYNKNKGYADFKQIQILYQNKEYAIVKSNTDYGLIEYDYIVLDAQEVKDDEFLK